MENKEQTNYNPEQEQELTMDELLNMLSEEQEPQAQAGEQHNVEQQGVEAEQQPSQETEIKAEEKQVEQEEIPDLSHILAEKEEIPEPEEVLPPEIIAQTAQTIAQFASEEFKRITGEDYDPVLASEQQRELYETLKQKYKKAFTKEYTQRVLFEKRFQKLERIAAELEKREPKLKEIEEWITTEAPFSVVAKFKKSAETAIATGNYDVFVRAWKELRDIFYKTKVKQVEPPKVEKAGVKQPRVEPQPDLRATIKSRIAQARGNLSAIAEAIPDDWV